MKTIRIRGDIERKQGNMYVISTCIQQTEGRKTTYA